MRAIGRGELRAVRLGARSAYRSRRVRRTEGPEDRTAAATIRLLAPLRQDLAEWRLGAGVPDDEAFLLPGRSDKPWQLHGWQNRRKRVFRGSAQDARNPAGAGHQRVGDPGLEPGTSSLSEKR